MWIQYKVKKDGEKLEDIAKQFKCDHKALLYYPKNKAVAAAYKKKQPLKKGTTIHLLDPKAKLYVVKHNGKEHPHTERQWKEGLCELDRTMDKAAKWMKQKLDHCLYKHQLQTEINDDFPIVSFFCSNWVGSEGDEPKATKKRAEAAVARLQSVCKSCNYKAFESATRDAEKAINAYKKELGEWVEQLTGSAGNWVDGLTVTRELSFVVFGAAAMTVAAPASALGTLAWGSGVGSGASFMSSSAHEVGRVFAGDDVKFSESAKKVAGDMVQGALFGALGAGVARFISARVAPKLAEKIVNSRVANKLSQHLVFRVSKILPKLSNRLYEREMAAVTQNLTKKLGADFARGTVLISINELDKMSASVVARFVIRLGVGGTSKSVQKVLLSRSSGMPVEKFLANNATKVKGNVDESKLAEMVAKHLETHPSIFKAFEQVVNDNMVQIEKELAAEIQSEIKERVKKAA